MLIGSSCSVSTEPLAELSPFWNLVLVCVRVYVCVGTCVWCVCVSVCVYVCVVRVHARICACECMCCVCSVCTQQLFL